MYVGRALEAGESVWKQEEFHDLGRRLEFRSSQRGMVKRLLSPIRKYSNVYGNRDVVKGTPSGC